MGLHDLFERVMRDYANVYDRVWKAQKFSDPISEVITGEIPNEIKQNVLPYKDVNTVYGRNATGRFAEIPWIMLSISDITVSAQDGVYIVYLFNKDSKELYLTLNQGAFGCTAAELRANAIDIRRKLILPKTVSVDSIDLGISKKGRLYNAGCICYKKYSLNTLPSDKELFDDLKVFLEIYEEYYKNAYSSSLKITKAKKNRKRAKKSIQDGIPFGNDSTKYSSNFIFYANDVKEFDMVEGLVKYLDEEYRGLREFSKKIFPDRAGDVDYIRVLLSTETPVDSHKVNDSYIEKVMRQEISEHGEEITLKKMREIVNADSIYLNRVGEYVNLKRFDADNKVLCDFPRYIVIYYKNFSCSCEEEYKAQLSQILAHEYLHYLHDVYSNCFFEDSYKADCVRESSADFFSVLYLLYSTTQYDYRERVARNRYAFWDKYFGSGLSYSYAKYYFYINGVWRGYSPDKMYYTSTRILYKFFDVFFESDRSMNDAYNMLIN